jgi:adenylate cyclase
LNALDLDDTLAEAYAALGYVHLVYDWDWGAAERALARAIELSPTYASAHQWRGELLLAQGRFESATESFQRAVDADPLSIPCQLGLGWAYYFSQQYDLAIRQHRKTLEIAPNAPMAVYGLLLSYHHKRMPEQAREELQCALQAFGDEPAAVMLRGVTQAIIGVRAVACEALERLEELAIEKYVPALYRAFIYIALKDPDNAFLWLERSFDERSTYLIFLKVQPALDHIRVDPRFQTLAARVGTAIG